MTIETLNSFTSFNLNPREELEGCTFNIVQLQKLQNRLSSIAEEKLSRTLGAEESYQNYFNSVAYLTGKLELLQQILLEHEFSAKELSNPNSVF